MAAETGWHGQKHYPAPMGHASWHAPFHHTSESMAPTEEKVQSRKSSELRRLGFMFPRRSPKRTFNRWTVSSALKILQSVLLVICLPIRLSTAAFINFDNCLSPNIIQSNTQSNDLKPLQFVPLFVWATFNQSAGIYNLNVTAYGNVAGIATKQPYPKDTDPQWANPNETVGKIPDIYGSGPGALYTTFTTEFNVLYYTPYAPDAARFCNTSSLTPCPVGPVFNFNGTE